jgi:hypothetical protein
LPGHADEQRRCLNNKVFSQSSTIMVPLSIHDFAFIVNVESFPSPYLVEMSQRRRIKKKNVTFYKVNVVFAPPKMNFIVKSILDNGPLFKIHLEVIKETMLEAIESNKEETFANGSILQTIGVESLVKQDILIRLNATGTGSTTTPLTRQKEHLFNVTLTKWRELQTKRLRDEHHLHCSFLSDPKRSKSELNYVMRKFKI